MQQVGTDSRFWWRALDAPTPRPAASQIPSKPGAAAWFYPARNKQQTNPRAASLKLEVPRGDRRLPGRRKSKTNSVGLLGLFAGMTMVSAAAVALVLSGRANHTHIQSVLAGQAVEALMAIGFGVDQVSVTGHHFTSDADVFDALDLPNVRTFAEFDSAAALKRIERLPWVDTAQITRVFPGSLSVQVRERLPSAIWDRGDKCYLIDATGRVLGPIPTSNGWELPRIAGEGANSAAALLLTALGRHSEIQRATSHAERISERRWAIVLHNGSRLELAADRESEGLELFASNGELRQALNGPASVIDVRTPGRAIIRPLPSAKTVNAPVASGPRT